MRKSILFIIALMTLSLLVSSASGQIQTHLRNRFVTEFERTQQVIEHARSVITASGTDRGAALLKMAITLQKSARENGFDNGRWEIGRRLTLEAREKAKEAIYANQRADENRNLVLNQLERTDELIRRVESHTDQNIPQVGLALFDSARKNQRLAWEFFHKGELRPALKLSRRAEKTIRNLVDRIQEQKGQLQRIQNQMRLLENNYQQARERIEACNIPAAKEALQRAEQAYFKAREFYDQGQLGKAEKQCNLARRLFEKALDLCPRDLDLEDKISRLNNELQRLREIALENDNRNALNLIGVAADHLRKAENFCIEGENDKCAANIRAAEMSLEKARKLLELP
jgi:hypothetical protein